MALELVVRLRATPDRCAAGHDQAIEAADRIEALESRLADKDASIAQLIEQLEKAEAQNAALLRSLETNEAHFRTSVAEGKE